MEIYPGGHVRGLTLFPGWRACDLRQKLLGDNARSDFVPAGWDEKWDGVCLWLGGLRVRWGE